MKTDEQELLQAVAGGELPIEAALRLKMHAKRMEYLCNKWAARRWFDCGVSVSYGWITDKGRERARQLAAGV